MEADTLSLTKDRIPGLDRKVLDLIESSLSDLVLANGGEGGNGDLKVPSGSLTKGTDEKSTLGGFLKGSSFESEVKISTKKKMLKDVDIQFALTALTSPISASEWSIECPDSDIAATLEAIIRPLWRGLINASLDAVPFGFQAIEKIYDVQDVEIRISDDETQTLQNRAIYSELFDVDPEKVKIVKDKEGTLLGYKVGETLVPIDLTGQSVDRGAIITLPRVRWGNYYGMGRLDIAYSPWWTKTATMRLMMRYLERHGDPPIVGEAPPGQSHGDQGQKVNNIDLMLEIMRKVKGHSSVVLPHQLDEKGNNAWLMNYLESDWERGDLWLTVLEHLSILIMRSFLAPEKTLVEGAKTGSFALVKEQRTVALQNAQSIQAEVFEQLSNQILPPLILANFGPNAPSARIVPGPLDQASLDLLAQVLGYIVDYEKGQVPERPLTEMVDRLKLLETLRVPLDQDLSSEDEDPDSVEISGEGTEDTGESGDVETRDIPDDEKDAIDEEQDRELSLLLASFRQKSRELLKEIRLEAERFKSEVQDPTFSEDLESVIKQVEKALNQPTNIQKIRALEKVSINSKTYQKVLQEFMTKMNEVGRRSFAEDQGIATPQMSTEDKEFIRLLSGSLARDRAAELLKIASVAGEGAVRWGQTSAEAIFEIRRRAEKRLKDLSNQTTAVSEAWRGFQEGRRAGAIQEIADPSDPIVAGRFVTVDTNTSHPLCQSLSGQVIRVDDPRFFALHPPLHHNCRSTMEYIRRSEFEKLSPPPFRRPPQSIIDQGDEFFVPVELLSSWLEDVAKWEEYVKRETESD